MKSESKQLCTAKLDRVRIVGGVRWPAQLPMVCNFATISDSFVSKQTTVRTYLRSRRMIHPNGTELFWQYAPQHRWLKPWRITFIGSDSRGLWKSDLKPVAQLCGGYSLLLVELAVDFSSPSGIDRNFVRRFGLFGKSRPDATRGGRGQVRYGTRHSDKLVRAYRKQNIDAFRIELEAHSGIVRSAAVRDINDVPNLARVLIPAHFQFAEIHWTVLCRYLLGKFGGRGPEVFATTRALSYSLHRALKYLRTCGVNNVHRFLRMKRETNVAKESVDRWAAAFREGAL